MLTAPWVESFRKVKRNSVENQPSIHKCNCDLSAALWGEVGGCLRVRMDDLPPLPPWQVIHDVHVEPAHVMKRRAVDQRLRVKLSYDRSVFR